MKIQRKNLKLEPDISSLIHFLLKHEPKDENENFGIDETISKSVTFDDGCVMDIKCCGVEYEEGTTNLPWTEAVLFNDKGGEICCSEVSDDFFGDWELEANGNKYIVHVS